MTTDSAGTPGKRRFKEAKRVSKTKRKWLKTIRNDRKKFFRIVWDQGQAGSTPVTRTKNPLKLTDFRGLFFAYCGAGFEDSYMNSMKTVT
jgi:hypothetical protein